MVLFVFLLLGLVVLYFYVKSQDAATSRSSASRRRWYIPPDETAEEIGKKGERLVYSLISRIEEPHYILNDLCFERKGGGSTQIDHVYINKRGIWVIETKNYKGKIYGKPHGERWTQSLLYGKETHTFYNPLKQNETHIGVLRSYLGKDAPLRSVVVFVNGDISAIDHPFVVKACDIDKILLTGDACLSSVEMQAYALKLQKIQEEHGISDEEHIENVEALQDEIENYVCPRCHKKLVVRTRKDGGHFWGCPSYPDCDYTRPY